MKNLLIGVLLVALLLSLTLHLRHARGEDQAAPRRMLAHARYIKLKNDSSAARSRFVADALDHLSGQPGVRQFWVGERTGDLHGRNAFEWDVAFHVVFESADAFERWRDGPEHRQFLAEAKENWKTFRPYNAQVSATGDE